MSIPIIKHMQGYQLRKLARQKKQADYRGFARVKNVALLYPYAKEGDDAAVLTFAQWLEESGKRVALLAFIPKKRRDVKQEPRRGGWFGKDQLNWYRKPNGEAVTDFLKEEYDLYIDFSLENRSVFLFITYLVRATFRVGHHQKPAAAYDLRVDLQKEALSQLRYYLAFINNREHETA